MKNCKITRFLKKLSIIVTLLLIIKVYYELKIIDLFIGIFKLEFLNGQVARVSQKSLMYITRKDDEDVFYVTMSSKRWNLIGEFGKGKVFEKDGEELVVLKKQFFNKYSVFEIQGKSIYKNTL